MKITNLVHCATLSSDDHGHMQVACSHFRSWKSPSISASFCSNYKEKDQVAEKNFEFVITTDVEQEHLHFDLELFQRNHFGSSHFLIVATKNFALTL